VLIINYSLVSIIINQSIYNFLDLSLHQRLLLSLERLEITVSRRRYVLLETMRKMSTTKYTYAMDSLDYRAGTSKPLRTPRCLTTCR